MVQPWAPLAINRLDSERLQNTKDAALAALTSKMIELDPNYPEDVSPPR